MYVLHESGKLALLGRNRRRSSIWRGAQSGVLKQERDYGILPIKYIARSSAHFLLTQIRVHTLLFEHVMQSHLSQMHEFFYA